MPSIRGENVKLVSSFPRDYDSALSTGYPDRRLLP